MALRPAINAISLCAGVGMLDEGVSAGFDAIGIDYSTLAYVERDGFAAATLVARMEGAALAPALVWDDLKTFPSRSFRGLVDCVVAGFPCQDLSVAGARAGLGGKRSGLFFDCLQIAEDCGAWCLVLENVAGIASATAAAVDETFGPIFERAAARVVGELADRGWDSEWMHVSAAEVGASHGRERWFCFAWRDVADSIGARRRSARDADRPGRPSVGEQEGARRGKCCRTPIGRFEFGGEDVAHAGNTRLQGHERREPHGPEHGKLASRPVAELCGAQLFAPGPQSEQWPRIIADEPHLAPAVEPGIRVLVDGMAYVLDESRADQLRCSGNGVVALCAAVAVVELVRRSGLCD